MLGPDCPEHREVVLRFYRGEFDDVAGAQVEEALSTCQVCAGWQRDALGVATVAEGVAAGFEGFLAARRRSVGGRRLAGVAAVILVACGGFLAWQLTQSGRTSARPETHSLTLADGSGPAEPEAREPWMNEFDFSAQQPIFADRLESGDLGGWGARNQ
jgi:hypothetical protein